MTDSLVVGAGYRATGRRVSVGFDRRARARARARARDGVGRGRLRGLYTAIREGVREALRVGGVDDADITVVLMDDEGIAALNARYLAHGGPTDVISFPMWSEGEVVTGDVCIGVEQALRQASALGVDGVEEFVRLAVHGTLHVLGWDHPERGDREESAMWALQEGIVAQVMSE